MNQWDGREEKEPGKDRGRDCPLPKGKKYKFWPWQSSLTCEGFLEHATFFPLFVLFSPLTLWGQGRCVCGAVVSNEIQKRASVGMARTLCIIITVNFRKNTLQNFWKMDVMILYLFIYIWFWFESSMRAEDLFCLTVECVTPSKVSGTMIGTCTIVRSQ